jgi:ribonuclease III
MSFRHNKLKKSSSTSSLSDSSDSEKKMYRLYNENNILVTKTIIQSILKKGGIKEEINKLSLYQQAFTNKSYSKNLKKKYLDKYASESESEIDFDVVVPIQEKSNETLEWLGDGVIQSAVAYYLFKRYKKQDEGFLTKTRSRLVKTEALAKVAKHLGFEKYILMSKHIEQVCNGRDSSSILEDTFEAFMGAMKYDFSSKYDVGYAYKLCSKFIINCLETAIDITEVIRKDDNYKDQLMRYFQKNFNGKYPKYDSLECSPEIIQNDNGSITRKFKINVCDIYGNKIGYGEARSKKQAEQRAAKAGLLHFGLINGF